MASTCKAQPESKPDLVDCEVQMQDENFQGSNDETLIKHWHVPPPWPSSLRTNALIETRTYINESQGCLFTHNLKDPMRDLAKWQNDQDQGPIMTHIIAVNNFWFSKNKTKKRALKEKR
jgi:hypothetical protein